MVYYYHPHTGRFEQSTRSTVRASTVGPTSRRAFDDTYLPPRTYIHHHPYDTTGAEYTTRSEVNRELIMSTAAMEDNYDITARSRARDRDVIAAANRAIVDTEVHSSPKSAVAAMRSMRGRSTPPGPVPVQMSRTEVHVALARASLNPLKHIVPPVSTAPIRRPRYRPRVHVKPRYRYHVPVRSARFVAKHRDASPDTEFEGQRRAPLSLLAYLRTLEMALKLNRYRPRKSYVPYRPAYKKAALLASKVESLMPERKRRPKSSYAQAKVRQMQRDKRDSGDVEAPVVYAEETSALRAHKPIYSPSLTKAHWDVDGVKKPHIMSMQNRLDTLVSPDDLIILPRSLLGVKTQLRDVQDKLDRHRQLMDRYLVTDKGLTSDDMQALAASKAHLGERI